MSTTQDDVADALTVLVVGLELVGQRWEALGADQRATIVACLRARTDRLTSLLFPEPVCVDLTATPEVWAAAIHRSRRVSDKQ